jgi:glycosyltransferase involved in cell wall biosynthesis
MSAGSAPPSADAGRARHVLVVSVVHTPQDARIRQRQIRTLLAAGWRVTFAAPWSAFGTPDDREVASIDLPRARGRRRLTALRAATRLLRTSTDGVDLVLLHDPELLLPAALARPRVPVVLDVHEDTAGALLDRPWIPRHARRVVAGAVRALERGAEGRVHLLLAEDGYAERFRFEHPVVPNVPPVPRVAAPYTTPPRAVYLGRISVHRGARELLEVGRRLAAGGVALDLVGPADADVEAAVRDAEARGAVRWHGFVPNVGALALVDGAVAGLSLLHDLPNYRVSAPTKVYEYLARGVPAVTTPLPVPADLVSRHDVGMVVPFGDARAAANAVMDLAEDPDRRVRVGARAHALALERFDWGRAGPAFVAVLDDWAAREGGQRES